MTRYLFYIVSHSNLISNTIGFCLHNGTLCSVLDSDVIIGPTSIRIVTWYAVHRGCTASHKVPICLELWSLAPSKLDYTLISESRWRTLNRKEKLRHRAVSLRQHGFLSWDMYTEFTKILIGFSLAQYFPTKFARNGSRNAECTGVNVPTILNSQLVWTKINLPTTKSSCVSTLNVSIIWETDVTNLY